MNTEAQLYGLMVEFLTPEAVLKAARRTRQEGFRDVDAYTPYTVEGLSTELGMRQSRIPSIVLIGGLIGAGAGYFMQYYSMAIDYQFNAGGRPHHSWPVFIPVTFEMLILVASFGAFISVLLLNGLPHPNHPVFNVPQFLRASQDRFFLCIEAIDPIFDMEKTTQFLASLEPHGDVILVPLTPDQEEEPESDDSSQGNQQAPKA